MKKVIAWLLVLALTAAISIGATLAYLTDTDEDVNVMTLGKVKIDQLEYERVDVESKDDDATVQEFHDNKPLLPAVTDKSFDYTPGTSYVDWEQIGKDGYTSPVWNPELINNEVDKMVFIKNKGDYDAYVRSVFAFEAGKYTTLDEFRKMVHLNLNETDYEWEWLPTPVTIGESTYFVATATYNKVLAPGALTEISLSQIALDKTATNADVEAFGDTYQVLVKSQGIQADGFTDADTALNEGFGKIATDNLPWENDAATKGANLKTAVRYLNADGATNISTKVNNVVFGLNEDYTDIINSNRGVLIDVEQDVPVYAYYLENGTGYDIYVLANDTIYAPKDSSSLFEDMSEIVTMDVENLDVSRVENATRMFRNCKKLQKLDTSNWDVSNMKTMERLFVNCYALENVDVSKWDTSNNTNFCMVFYGCTAMDKVDVSQWDTSKGTLFNSMFAYSPKFNLDREALKNWDMSSAVRINHMFYGCSAQEELDLSGWDMPNMITTTHMFADCNSLRSVDFTGWNTPSLVSMDAMFNDCHSLTYLDVSSFDTANCNEFTQVFESCKNLKTIVGLDKWDTGNARTYEELFSGCAVLKEVDLSTFKSRDVVNDFTMEWKGTGWGFLRMFSGMNSLEKMTLSADFSFDGDGKVTTESYKVSLPSPAAKEGFTAKWKNVDTGVLYDASEIPEETAATYVAYYEYIPSGATMYNALHYLNANPSGTKITANVTNVTFGLSKDYEEITSQYTGALMDAEQDGPVYAYYVPNGNNYDVYFLADTAIYTPKNSFGLFKGMSALTSVNTANLNTGRTVNMGEMFRDCTKLTQLDASKWDTSNVTDMESMFRACKALTAVDASGWDVSKVEDFYCAFYQCSALTTVKASGWSVDSATDMSYMFRDCGKLTTLDVSGWGMGKVKGMNQMFYNCSSLATLDVSKWDTSSSTDMNWMFANCGSLTALDVSGWKTGNVTRMAAMFRGCLNIEELAVSEWDVSKVTTFESMFQDPGQNNSGMKLKALDLTKWQTGNATNMAAMFYGCGALTELDLHTWDVSKVTTFSHTFADCRALTSINVKGWKTNSLEVLDGIFNNCDSVKELDVSTFNTSKVHVFAQVFEACYALERVIGLENWDTSNGNDFSEFFNVCYSLKEANLSSFNTKKANSNPQTYPGVTNWVFLSFFGGCNKLEKVTFGPDFSFDGIGTCPAGYKFGMPAATGVAGWDGNWYDADGNPYAPSAIQEEKAATYYAVKPVTP